MPTRLVSYSIIAIGLEWQIGILRTFYIFLSTPQIRIPTNKNTCSKWPETPFFFFFQYSRAAYSIPIARLYLDSLVCEINTQPIKKCVINFQVTEKYGQWILTTYVSVIYLIIQGTHCFPYVSLSLSASSNQTKIFISKNPSMSRRALLLSSWAFAA